MYHIVWQVCIMRHWRHFHKTQLQKLHWNRKYMSKRSRIGKFYAIELFDKNVSPTLFTAKCYAGKGKIQPRINNTFLSNAAAHYFVYLQVFQEIKPV